MLYGIGFYFGFFFLIQFINNKLGKRTTILTFHRIASSNNKKIKQSLPTSFISDRNFEEIIKFLSKYYNFISLADYLDKFNNQKQPPKNSIIITFDDGYGDIYENGFPIFIKYKIPAIIFLTSSFINDSKVFWWDHLYALCRNGIIDSSQNQFTDEIYTQDIKNKLLSIFALDRKKRDPMIISFITELQDYDYSKIKYLIQDLTKRVDVDLTTLANENRMLSWNDIKKLNTVGIAFGSHTKSHQFFSNNLPKHTMIDELTNSKIDLENKLNNKIEAFAYPGGKISPQIKELVKENGYKIACTQSGGINTIKEDIFAIKRINIWDGTVEGIRGKFSKSLLALTLIKNSFS